MEKSTGIIRKVDELGRIVIPIELRSKLNIGEKDPIEIFTKGTSIILQKYEKNCVFCSSTKELVKVNDKVICKNCLESLKNL